MSFPMITQKSKMKVVIVLDNVSKIYRLPVDALRGNIVLIGEIAE